MADQKITVITPIGRKHNRLVVVDGRSYIDRLTTPDMMIRKAIREFLTHGRVLQELLKEDKARRNLIIWRVKLQQSARRRIERWTSYENE